MPADIILFDLNETVLDLAPLQPLFQAHFRQKGAQELWFQSLLHSSTVCALTEVETSFSELAAAALDRIAAAEDRLLTDEARDEILGAVSRLDPHEDVRPALTRLREAGRRPVAFTNSARQVLDAQMTRTGLDELFERTLSVEPTGCFKPAAEVYRFAERELDCQAGQMMLVACHDWDTHGALSAGWQAAFVDRKGLPYHPLYRQPNFRAPNLGQLVDQLLA